VPGLREPAARRWPPWGKWPETTEREVLAGRFSGDAERNGDEAQKDKVLGGPILTLGRVHG
jgi:hypothetical protein